MWPEGHPTSLQRTARTESYGVTIGWGEGLRHELEDLDAISFARWPMGQAAQMRVTNIDAVVECHPK